MSRTFALPPSSKQAVASPPSRVVSSSGPAPTTAAPRPSVQRQTSEAAPGLEALGLRERQDAVPQSWLAMRSVGIEPRERDGLGQLVAAPQPWLPLKQAAAPTPLAAVPSPVVQAQWPAVRPSAEAHAAARPGISGAGGTLPYLQTIQRAFGRHEVSAGGAQADKANNTGLPDDLKSGIEFLAGMSLDNVRVHYNSLQPAQLNALAYAKGTDIHLGPGQEEHLPHEAWHVVQQAQGRVQATTTAAETPINDSPALEAEATQMGAAAIQRVSAVGNNIGYASPVLSPGIVQRVDEADEAVFVEFGNKHRNRDFDPDVLGEEHNGINQVDPEEARPEDAPIVNEFRQSFHKLHSAKIYLETNHHGLVAGFELANAGALNNLSVRDYLIQIAGAVKEASKNYKKSAKDLSTNTSVETLQNEYTNNVRALGVQALDSANLIQTYIANNSDDDRDLEAIHAAGTDIWRDTWHRAVIAVNTVLHARWPHWENEISAWIEEKRDDEGLAYMDPEQVIGIDYIGSLAKGYKGPPKQAIRFTPEKFDVDANLTAPPLAAYAITVGHAIVDRGRIWSHRAGMALFNGLLKPMQDDIQAHLVDAGLIDMGMDPHEPFEAVIDAEGLEDLAHVPNQAVVSKTHSEADLEMRNTLYFLRHSNRARFQRVGTALTEAGFSHVVGEGAQLNEHDDANQTYAFTAAELVIINQIIAETL